jgi:hypothetical protein
MLFADMFYKLWEKDLEPARRFWSNHTEKFRSQTPPRMEEGILRRSAISTITLRKSSESCRFGRRHEVHTCRRPLFTSLQREMLPNRPSPEVFAAPRTSQYQLATTSTSLRNGDGRTLSYTDATRTGEIHLISRSLSPKTSRLEDRPGILVGLYCFHASAP